MFSSNLKDIWYSDISSVKTLVTQLIAFLMLHKSLLPMWSLWVKVQPILALYPTNWGCSWFPPGSPGFTPSNIYIVQNMYYLGSHFNLFSSPPAGMCCNRDWVWSIQERWIWYTRIIDPIDYWNLPLQEFIVFSSWSSCELGSHESLGGSKDFKWALSKIQVVIRQKYICKKS